MLTPVDSFVSNTGKLNMGILYNV